MEQKIKFKDKLQKFKHYLSDMFFPRNIKCVFCKDELNNNEFNSTCELCLSSLPFINKACPRCGGVLPSEATGVCVDCKINNYEFVQAFSVFEYKNQVSKVLHDLKYNKKKYLVEPIAKYMAQKINILNISVDLITCVPIHKDRLKLRGFNQSELISKEISKLTNIPFYNICEKFINTKSQTELGFSERKENVKDSFKIIRSNKHLIKDKNVLVIDDIFTTGATSNEVCKVLLNAGANNCYVLTFAHVNIERIKKDN